MILLKANNGKSVVVNYLCKYTDSICFEYYNDSVIYDTESIYVNSDEYSLIDLKGAITEVMDENDYSYTYLIVYTNETEDKLEDFIRWLDENKLLFHCMDIIVACK